MKLSQFTFDLPLNLIAQTPALRRQAIRMLVIDRKTGTMANRHFNDFPEYFNDKDVFVVHNTKFFPARLYGRTETPWAHI